MASRELCGVLLVLDKRDALSLVLEQLTVRVRDVTPAAVLAVLVGRGDRRPDTDGARRRTVDGCPTEPEEAIEQMELLGHNFFVFFNSQDGQVNVVYRRNDGHIGWVDPDLAGASAANKPKS